MALTLSQKMLKKLRVSMKMDTLTGQERLQCDIKLKLTEKIDHILYTEWDPSGVSSLADFDCSDEYHSYLPSVVNLVFEGGSIAQVADLLLKWEDLMQREYKIPRRCDVIAVMVSHYGPHAGAHPFVPAVDTTTPERAYQSVLDLVTQTRLDAYQHKFSAVRSGYEKAVTICQENLPEHHGLKGACLSNLGMAYSLTGEPEKAQEMYERALSDLAPDAQTDADYFMVCLSNLINHLEHHRQFAATWPYYEQMLQRHVTEDGWDDEQTLRAKKRLAASGNTRRPAPKLRPRRIPVERDSPSKIGQLIVIE